jgi:hypothetical protein
VIKETIFNTIKRKTVLPITRVPVAQLTKDSEKIIR